MTVKYNLVKNGDEANITVFVNGEMYVANSDHPNFRAIVGAALEDDPEVVDLFDAEKGVEKRFERLSERVSFRDGNVYVDGVQVNGTLTEKISQYVREGHEAGPLVNFLEKLETNSVADSKEQLYTFLSRHDFTITDEGDFIAYKGVNADLTSIHAGPAVVDGREVDGHVPNYVGAVVEIARDKVTANPSVGCASGLHSGTFDYAAGFGTKVLKVLVNPRDVVSVPRDCSFQKIRSCRYTVLEVIEKPVNSMYDGASFDLDDLFDCEYCGYELDEDGFCDNCEDYSDGIPVADVTRAEKWDTRKNYTKQKRDANGRFLPKS